DGEPALQVQIFYREKKPVTWVVNRTLTLVGRSDVCSIRFHDASVSRVHCSLLRTPTGMVVVDLGGRGGVSINGRQLLYGLFEEGDDLQPGPFRLRLTRRRASVALKLPPGTAAVRPSPRAPAPAVPAPRFPEVPALNGVPLTEDSLTGLLMLRLLDQFARLQ